MKAQWQWPGVAVFGLSLAAVVFLVWQGKLSPEWIVGLFLAAAPSPVLRTGSGQAVPPVRVTPGASGEIKH